MANVNAPNGFSVVGSVLGSAFNAKPVKAYVASGDNAAGIFVGDIVMSSGSSDAATGLFGVKAITAGNSVMRGVVVGVDAVQGAYTGNINLAITYLPTSTAGYIWINEDPYVLLEAQANGATIVGDIGTNARVDIATATGNTFTGSSGMQIDIANKGNSEAPLRLYAFVQDVGNVIASTYSRLQVTPSSHELKSATGV